MRINTGEEEQPEIGLIALIDCIFFLLMFFMVATSFNQQAEMQSQNNLPVVLPEANANLNPVALSPNTIAIGIDKKGNLFLGAEPISIQKLQQHLKQAAEDKKETLIEISGDEFVAYKYIVNIVDVCQFEGFVNISLRTRVK